MAVPTAEMLLLAVDSAWTEGKKESMRVGFENIWRDEARARELGILSAENGRWAVGGGLGSVFA